MDWSWLTGIFGDLFKIFKGIVTLKWSEIWQGLQDLIRRFKDWHRWYVANVQKPIQQARANFRKLMDRFVLPVIHIIDTVRRITGIIGLFNQRLAAKLNSVFFRIEGALLAPLRSWLNRMNTFGGIFRSLLTPLGYLDRATLLNSVWRDVGHMREILRNPLGGQIVAAGPASRVPIVEQVGNLTSYFKADSGPLATAVDNKVDVFNQNLAQS